MRLNSLTACLSLSSLIAACLLALAGCQSATTRGTNANANRTASQSAGPAATAQPADPTAPGSTPPAHAAQTNAGQPAAADSSSALAAAASSPPSSKQTDPCALLTADDIKSVQGEAATQIKPSRRAESDRPA